MEHLSKIQQTITKLLGEKKLFPEEKLKEYYETFRHNFGPEKLRQLDGEVLLETMFNHGNRRSLVYWLEFKNDEEFSTNAFGSIAGGSAFKFGIFKRNEDGKWITGNPKNKREITVDEAIEIAREKRDILIKGYEIIKDTVVNYEDSTYIKLQNELDKNLGQFANTGWVHKYFHMMFPDKIDDFHSEEFQRFYLIKLLQKPVKDQGRYVTAGQYMRLVKSLGVTVGYFSAALKEVFGSPHNYWGINAGDGKNNYWDEMVKNSCIFIGWPELGDLSQLDFTVDSTAKQKIQELLEKYYPGYPGVKDKTAAKQILLFMKYIKPDDIVVATEGKSILGIGRVIEQYEYNKKLPFPHTIKVKWLKTEKTSLPDASEILPYAVYQLKDYDNLLFIEKTLQGISGQVFNELDSTTFTGIIGRIASVLNRKKQVIIYGPPGTGKTYWAEKASLELAAKKAFGKSFDELSENEKAIVKGAKNTPGLVCMCTFHPSYSYEDFIEGIKPAVINNQTVFSLKAGIFKKLCEDARNNPDKNYYLIIDEINRGDISRIFGELITLIEANKRGKETILPLSGEPFTVPENVYLIGTMNTADRSIALLDIALRRRFSFIELMPDYSILRDVIIEGIPLGPWLEELNKRIRENIGRDARNLQIGHAYFMENGKVIREYEKFCKVIQEDLLPLLEEYCYGDYLTLAKIIGNGLVDKDKQMIKHELFTNVRKTELISALLEISPELATSSSVLAEELEQDEEQESEKMAGDNAV